MLPATCSPVRALVESTGTPFTAAEYGPRGVVFSQGDPCDSVMYIEQGRVRLVHVAPGGDEAICGLMGIGAFLGEEVLGGRAERRQTAIAMIATRVLAIARAPMIRLLHSQQPIADRFIAHILARHSHLEADLADQLLHPAEQRVARALIVLAGCGEGRLCRCALPDVSQEVIAEMVGTTRSRVNGFLRKFRTLGLIAQDGATLHITPSLLSVVPDAVAASPMQHAWPSPGR
jgi:CRP-like cAMP-binding protein